MEDKNQEVKLTPYPSPLKVIRLRCVDCMGGNFKLIKGCFKTSCWSYPYREGHNPFRKKPTGRRRDTQTGKFIQGNNPKPMTNGTIIEGKFKLVRIDEAT